MEDNSKVMQTTSYDINNSHYEVVRIFDKNRDIKSLIEENISAKNAVNHRVSQTNEVSSGNTVRTTVLPL